MSKTSKIIIIVVSVLVALAILCLAAIMIAGGAFVKPKYLEPWDKEYHTQFDEVRKSAAAHGLLAPNNHNMQSWLLNFPEDEPHSLYIYVNPEREIAADPTFRENVYTQGAFVAYTEIAANKLGYNCVVEAMPQGDWDENNIKESMKVKPVAKMTFVAEEDAKQSDLAKLYDNIFVIDVNRAPYAEDKPTDDQINALKSLSNGDINVTVKTSEEDVKYIGEQCVKGKKAEYDTESITTKLEEIFRPNEYQKNKFKYGVSLEGDGSKGITKIFHQGVLTLMPWIGSGERDDEKAIKDSEKLSTATPAYIIITDKDNTRESQLEVGRIYARLVFEAHRQGLVVQPVSQPIGEFEKALPIRAEMQAKFSPDAPIAMLVRLGKATKQFPHNMRQNLQDSIYKPEV